MVQKSKKAMVVTSIYGLNENSNTGGQPVNSAIPGVYDEWFHGDRRTSLPLSRSSALGTKSLEEYDRTFPNYRIKSGIEIDLDTDGRTISSYGVTPDRNLASITLEGGENEPNPFRDEFDDFDGEKDYISADKKGPFTKTKKITVKNNQGVSIEGVRSSVIYGGSDRYLVKAKEEGVSLSRLVSGSILAPLLIPIEFANYYFRLPPFYSFLDFIYMADGSRLARVWDASAYPAHALYVGEERRDITPFRRGIEWTIDDTNAAFEEFVDDGTSLAKTPFRPLSPLRYKNAFRSGNGPHPVLDSGVDGSKLTIQKLENEKPSPLIPPLA